MFTDVVLTSLQEEVAKTGRDDRPSVSVSSEKKMDTAAVGNHNKVKVMATQLLAKFEENAPAHHSGLKRQVWRTMQQSVIVGLFLHIMNIFI